eukprot:767662-Hanusia_phi.AAC.5
MGRREKAKGGKNESDERHNEKLGDGRGRRRGYEENVPQTSHACRTRTSESPRQHKRRGGWSWEARGRYRRAAASTHSPRAGPLRPFPGEEDEKTNKDREEEESDRECAAGRQADRGRREGVDLEFIVVSAEVVSQDAGEDHPDDAGEEEKDDKRVDDREPGCITVRKVYSLMEKQGWWENTSGEETGRGEGRKQDRTGQDSRKGMPRDQWMRSSVMRRYTSQREAHMI